MVKKYLTLNDITTYKISFNLSNYVWNVIDKWDKFAKFSIGSQFVRSVDSVSANVAEGFGRFGKKDNIAFYRIARASVFESLDWAEKANSRTLISKRDYDYIFKILKSLPREINSLIKFTNNNLTI
jgi:four helix bundle protein